MMFHKPFLIITFLSVILLFTQGCADSPTEARARLEQRVNAYFTALKINDLATAYRMQSGARDGSLTADLFHRLMTQSGGRLINYKIEDIQIEGESATIKAELTYQYPQLHQPYIRSRSSQWIMLDGDWYHKSPTIPSMK
ncbi:hypothetical protein GWK36_12160 [Caldichromatium japonicum]|uniref:Uncharacterized protein n=1 Tax=Caldichromatium japonicum TaxID=2699430 RepID=A0A6G7VF13_9GAMM|nr:hypothetical protein [Caldichromatium japonicum]QIK38611.1 hypothetical protein GWK36_12160 [Caldichromatium japonicum]